MIAPVTNLGTTKSAYQSLYKTGGAAALIAGVLFRRNLDAEYMLLSSLGVIHLGPAEPPSTIMDWFTLLLNQPLIGLTLLNFFDVVNYVLIGLIFLALGLALRRASESGVAIAAALSFAGITVYFSSNQALGMLSLSHQYAAATTDAQRGLLLAAGQAILVIHNSATYLGTGIYLSFLFVSAAGLILSIAMLRSNLFSKGTAIMGILANVCGLGYYLILVFAPSLVFIPLSISAIFLLTWYLLIGFRLWALGT